MLKKYFNPNFVNTSDATYSQQLFVGGNNVVIPYINMGLIPDNPITGKQSIIDYSYYVFKEVQSMDFNASKGKMFFDFNLLEKEDFITEYIIVGGYKSENGAEVKIEYKNSLLYVHDSAKVNPFPILFMPIETPHFKQNIKTEDAAAFFLLENLPSEIKEILGNRIYSLEWL